MFLRFIKYRKDCDYNKHKKVSAKKNNSGPHTVSKSESKLNRKKKLLKKKLDRNNSFAITLCGDVNSQMVIKAVVIFMV